MNINPICAIDAYAICALIVDCTRVMKNAITAVTNPHVPIKIRAVNWCSQKG